MGNLSAESDGSLSMEWTNSGKLKKVTKPGVYEISFTYDAMGNRVTKHFYDIATDETYLTYYVRDAQGNNMATYLSRDLNNPITQDYHLKQLYLYGSNRLGYLDLKTPIQNPTSPFSELPPPGSQFFSVSGTKRYELSNHLGNVLAVVSDNILANQQADLVCSNDYFPFGSPIQQRCSDGVSNQVGNSFRFGFNGKENDDEIKGDGNSVDFGARVYDGRLGRFLSLDPKINEYPSWSPYIYAMDNPIRIVDIDGEGPGDGLYRVYIHRVEITTAKGVEWAYLAKRYYKNITPQQLARYNKAAQTPNGWYVVSQDEYRAQQQNPKAFSWVIAGADTPEKYRELTSVIGPLFDNPINPTGAQKGQALITTSGKDLTGSSIEETFTFQIVDKDGKVVSSESKKISGSGTISFEYDLKEGQSFVLQGDKKTSDLYTLKVKTLEKKGERVIDNFDDYGTEEPDKVDKKAIEQKLDKQRKK